MRPSTRFSPRTLRRFLIGSAMFFGAVMGSRLAPPVAGDNPATTAPATASQADERALKALAELSELGKKPGVMTFNEKLARVREVADHIDFVIPQLKDPAQMMRTAATIFEYGIIQDVNSLEYWGEDPVTQAHLKPLSGAVVKLLAAASKAAEKRAVDLSALDLTREEIAREWERMDNLSHSAAYARNMSAYFDCIATSPKLYVDPRTNAVLTLEEAMQRVAARAPVVRPRLLMVREAIAGLKDFDTPDSGVQPRIRNMIAKLYMAAGSYAKAREVFLTVYTDKTDLIPAPDPLEQYEARYFTVVAEVLDGRLADAINDSQSLDMWQTTTFPTLLKAVRDNAGQRVFDDAAIAKSASGVSITGALLQWRVLALRSNLAPNADARKAADNAIEAVLLKLKIAHPELAARIDRELVNRISTERIVDDSLPSSILLALVNKGIIETSKSESDKPDHAVLEQATLAARVIISRGDSKNPKHGNELTPRNIAETVLALAELQESMGDDVDAALGYLQFALPEPLKAKKCGEALDRAGYLIFNKMAKGKRPPGYEEVYAQFLPVAIGAPFNRTNLTYLYAEQLRDRREFELAIKFYRLVPKDSPDYGAVDFKIMLTLNAMLDPENGRRPDEPTRKKTVAELKLVAGELKKPGKNPSDDVERNRAIAATLILANLAQMDKDAKQVLLVLAGFDELVDGLTADGKPQTEQEALANKKLNMKRAGKLLVVRAMIHEGMTDEAVQETSKFLANSSDADGVLLARDLLDLLGREYDAAEARTPRDTKAMREARKNQARLSGYMADFSNPAKGQTNPKIASSYYAYAEYDARMQREAGVLAENLDERKKLLNSAEEKYRALLGNAMHDLYLAQPEVKKEVDAGKLDPADPDPQVAINLARAAFDLGDFETARTQLSRYVRLNKLGPPCFGVVGVDGKLVRDNDGLPTIGRFNDLYWEVIYKFIKSAYETRKDQPEGVTEVKNDLQLLLVRCGVPAEWEERFKPLQKVLGLPELTVARIGTPGPAVDPRTAAPSILDEPRQPAGIPFQSLNMDPIQQAAQEEHASARSVQWPDAKAPAVEFTGASGDLGDAVVDQFRLDARQSFPRGAGLPRDEGDVGDEGLGMIFGALWSHGGGPTGPVFGNGGNARHIVFVCDASGSMINKMPTLKDQLSRALQQLRPVQSFEMIFFQDNKYDSFLKFDHRDGLVLATAEAKRAAGKFLEGVTTTGATDPIPGIIAAFKTHPQLIYLLTDGDFPDNDAVLKTIRDLNKDHKVKINTIAFVGDGDNETAFLTLLQTIAKENGGKFKHVKESDL